MTDIAKRLEELKEREERCRKNMGKLIGRVSMLHRSIYELEGDDKLQGVGDRLDELASAYLNHAEKLIDEAAQ